MLAPARLVLPPVHPARRAPVLPAHRRRAQARRQRVLPGRVPAHRRLRRRRRRARQPGRAHRDPRHRLRRQGRLLPGPPRAAPLTDPRRARSAADCGDRTPRPIVQRSTHDDTATMSTDRHTAAVQRGPGSAGCCASCGSRCVLGAVLGIAVGLLLPRRRRRAQTAQRLVHRPRQDDRRPGHLLRGHHAASPSMDNLRKAGRIGVKALGYFMVLSLLSMLIGLVVGQHLQARRGDEHRPGTLDPASIPGQRPGARRGSDFIDRTHPGDPLFGALTGDASCRTAGLDRVRLSRSTWPAKGTPITDGISALTTWSSSGSSAGSCGWRPIGTFGALAAVVATYGAASLQQLGYLILLFTGTCVVYVFVVLGPDHAGLQAEPVRADALPQGRTADRAEPPAPARRCCRSWCASWRTSASASPSSASSSRPGSRSTSTAPRST